MATLITMLVTTDDETEARQEVPVPEHDQLMAECIQEESYMWIVYFGTIIPPVVIMVAAIAAELYRNRINDTKE